MNFKNLAIKTKIQLTVGIPCLVMLIAGVLIFSNLKSMVTTSGWVAHTNKVLAKADGIIASAVDMETGMRGFLLAGKEEFLDPYNSGEKSVYQSISSLQQTVSDNPPQVRRLSEVETTLKEWQSNITEPMIQERRKVGVSRTMDDIADVVGEARGKKYFDKFRSLMAEFKQIESDLMIQREEDNREMASFTETVIIVSVLFAVFIGATLGLFFVKELMSELGGEPKEVNEITSQIASGNLAVVFSDKSNDSSIYGAMRKMVEQLRAMISDINNATTELSVAANQTNSIANETSNSISIQLDETTQVATAINEMSATVKDVANSISEAATASNQVNTQVAESQIQMTKTVQQMNDLHKGVESASNVILNLEKNTTEINSIVEVIKGVAEQTNLLALNAAIEAARAGEQGRGFAVVADEVRSLAERTQQSTQEINNMIDELTSDVQQAVSVMADSRSSAEAVTLQINSTNEVLNSIQQSVEDINDINTQISSAAEEQSVVVEEINENILRVNDIAEKTSQGAKETATTGANMQEQSSSLQNMVKRFSL